MNKPHKHADLIKAWADGAEIQAYSQADDVWLDTTSPFWYDDMKYRIKPEPKPDEFVYIGFDGIKAMDAVINPTCIYDWTNKVKLTFDGKTGKLKNAEVIHNEAI